MSVVNLVPSTNKETVDALAYMLHEAQKGEINGVNATFRRPSGREAALSTGAYKARPELALMAILRFSMALMRANGEDPGP